jgi:hypothetical protein
MRMPGHDGCVGLKRAPRPLAQPLLAAIPPHLFGFTIHDVGGTTRVPF